MSTYGIKKKVRLAMGIEAAAAVLLLIGMGWRLWDVFVLLFVLLLSQYLPVTAALSEEQALALDRETGNFSGGRPLRKKLMRKAAAAVLLLVLGGVLSVLFRVFYGLGVGYCGSEHIGYNENAKFTYTNAATCVYYYEQKGGDPSDMDGTYWGSLQPEKGQEYSFRPVPGKEGFDDNMKALTGSMSQAYYYVVIKGGSPVQTYWSKSDELLYYAERYAERFGQGEVEGDFYIGGEYIGSYPKGTFEKAAAPPEWLKLTSSDRMRIRIKDLRKNCFYYIIFIAPLLNYLIVGLFTKIGSKNKKEISALENV